MSESATSSTDREQVTRGAFPRYPLSTIEEVVMGIYEAGQGDRARTITVLANLNRSVTSSTTKSVLSSASRGYGLISGNTGDTHLTLTDRGMALATASNDYERLKACYEALNHNEVFRAFIERFKHRPMPRDEVAIDFLRDSFHFGERDASAAVDTIKKNLRDYGLLEAIGEHTTINPPDEVLPTVMSRGASDAPPVDKNDPNPDIPISSSAVQAVVQQATGQNIPIAPQFVFNIQIQLPESSSPETYETIFRTMAVHLLGRSSD